MSIPEQQEQPIEERIGSAIGKAFVLARLLFLLGAMGQRWPPS
jgi:hypothetical protein